jgi:hypothetical protein
MQASRLLRVLSGVYVTVLRVARVLVLAARTGRVGSRRFTMTFAKSLLKSLQICERLGLVYIKERWAEGMEAIFTAERGHTV